MAVERAFLNGEFLPISQAKVSIEDRGFQFGDGLFEVIRRYPQGFFEIHRHMIRISRSAEKLGFSLPYGAEEMVGFARELAGLNSVDDGELYVQVTRGTSPRQHRFPENPRPTVVMTLRPVRPIPSGYRKNGAPAITFPDIRWGWCHLKSINLLPNVLAKEAAFQAGVYEAFFVRDGHVTEGASSNIFICDGHAIITPAVNNILPGVTREVALELIASDGLPLSEQPISLERLLDAKEVFLTSTVSEIMPVVRVDEQSIGDGRPGEITRRLQTLFTQRISQSLTTV